MALNFDVYSRKLAALHANVGRVMDLWANLEAQMLSLTAWGLKTDIQSTAKICHAFRTFSLTLDFTKSVCAARLTDQTYLNSWADLMSEISGDRNFVAHTPITAHGFQNNPSTEDWAKAVPLIGPALKEYLSGATPRRSNMDLRDVFEVAEDVQHLISETMGFSRVLASGGALPDKYLHPIPLRRPRLSARRTQRDAASDASPKASHQ